MLSYSPPTIDTQSIARAVAYQCMEAAIAAASERDYRRSGWAP